MLELEMEEAQELLIGTWVGVALLANMLIENGALSKEELLWTLSQIEAMASDNRRTALANLRRLITRGLESSPSIPPANTEICALGSRRLSGCQRSPLRRPIDTRSYAYDSTGNLRAFIDMSVDKRHRER
jgi:hypothetical protein